MDQFDDTTPWDIAWLRSVGFQAEGDSEVYIFDREKDLRIFLECDRSAAIGRFSWENHKCRVTVLQGTFGSRGKIRGLLASVGVWEL